MSAPPPPPAPSPAGEDDASSHSSSSVSSASDASAARYVEGPVGLARGALEKKFRAFRGRTRRGTLSIDLDDGGTVRFHRRSVLRARKGGIRDDGSGAGGGDYHRDAKDAEDVEEASQARAEELKSMRTAGRRRRRNGGEGDGGGEEAASVIATSRRKRDAAAAPRFSAGVRASTTPYEEPDGEEPHLRIPASVPWKFEAINDRSFNIVVPPHEGKKDYRVELNSFKYLLNKRTEHRPDDDHSSDSPGSAGGGVDGEPPSSPSSSGKASQVFTFHCPTSGEIAVYARAAQCLGRNRTAKTNRKAYSVLLSPAKSRSRTPAGVEIAAHVARVGRSASVARVKAFRASLLGEREFQCFPLYCYPDTWMTKANLATELVRSSKNVRDLQRGSPEEIGSLKVEVIQCIGLPNLDVYGLTDAYVYVVCGSSTFVTDIIPENCNPCWLPMARRACILPIHNGYSQVFVGAFDYDGEGNTDDFAGRVVIDIPRLRSGSTMDVTLPLRDCSSVYNRKKLGSIRLRLRLDWAGGSERAALLSYLPKTPANIANRIKSPSDPVTVCCPDAKSFRNIALTVYGRDLPGKYNSHMLNSATREMKLIQRLLVYHTKQKAMNIVTWKSPLLSLYILWMWMYCVLRNPAFLPAGIVSLVFLFMLRNYLQYHVGSAANLTDYRNIWSMTMLLLFNQSYPKNNGPRVQHEKSLLHLLFGIEQRNLAEQWNYEDHVEFPLSMGHVYPKLTTSEAAGRETWEAAQDENNTGYHHLQFSDDDSLFNSSHDTMSMGSLDDEGYLDDRKPMSAFEKTKRKVGKVISESLHTTKGRESMPADYSESIQVPTAPAGKGPAIRLPDQNILHSSDGTKHTIQYEIDRAHSKAQRASLHLFDDRVFIADDGESRLFGVGNNPLAKFVNPILSKVIKILSIGLSGFRVIFNVLFWKDPMLSYWALVFFFCLMVVLLIFPWNKFFFLLGLFGLGPQNYFLAKNLERKTKRTPQQFLATHEKEAVRPPLKISELQKSPLLLRNNAQMKPDSKIREVIVPSIPFRCNRFYDWPPDPASTTIKDSTANEAGGSHVKTD